MASSETTSLFLLSYTALEYLYWENKTILNHQTTLNFNLFREDYELTAEFEGENEKPRSKLRWACEVTELFTVDD